MKVLYVEDNPSDADLALHVLKKKAPDINIEVVNTLSKAISVLDSTVPEYDVILTDLGLPDGNGTSLLTHIRKNNLPYAVVVITGNGDEDTIVTALKAGADDYVIKRFDYLERLHLILNIAYQKRVDEGRMRTTPLRILYVENNPADAELTIQHMRNHSPHIHIDVINNAEKVLERLSQPEIGKGYDLILLDYLLPGMDAFELMTKLKEIPGFVLPVVLITGHGSEEIVLQATRLGVADYVAKSSGYLFRLPFVLENAYYRGSLSREQAALRESEARFRRISENAQDIIYRIDLVPQIAFQYISPAIELITGYPPNDFYKFPRLALRMVHPEDRKRLFDYLRSRKFEQPLVVRWKGKNKNTIWVEQRNVPIWENSGKLTAIEGIVRDITISKLAEEALHRRDAIMEAISFAAEQFLIGSWEEKIHEVLERLGQAAKVSRSYIFRNRITRENRVLADMIYEWVAPGIEPQIFNPEMTNFDFDAHGFENWIPLMRQGKPIYGKLSSFSKAEREVFHSQGIKSLMCVPIFVDTEWWGFIGFDDCKSEREWPSTDIDTLKTAANVLGAAVQREKAQTALQKQVKELTTIQSLTEAGTLSTSIDELIEQATISLAATLNANDCGVLLHDKELNILKCHSSYITISQEVREKGISISEGITGKVFRTGVPVVINDISQEPDYLSTDLATHSEACFPIIVNHKIIGVLNAESPDYYAFQETEEKLMQTIANQLATGMQKIQLLDIERKRRQEAETLRKAATALSSTLELSQVLETILISLKEVVPYDSASVFLQEQDKLRLTSVQGFLHPEKILGMSFPASDLLFQEIVSTGQPLIIKNATNDSRFCLWADTDYVRGWMGVPLITRGNIIGYITLDSRQEGAYDKHIAAVAQAFAHQAAVAIENARLYAEIRHRLNELEAVNKISVALRTAQTLDEMLPRLLVETLNIIHANVGAIWLYDSATDELYQAAGRGWITRISNMRMKPGKGIVGQTFASGEISVSPDFSGLLLQEIQLPTDEDNNHSSIEVRKNAPMEWGGACFPIHATDQIVGVLFVQPSHHLTREELKLLTTMTEMGGNAIHRATLYFHTGLQVQKLTALRDVDIAISSSFDLRVTLDIIIDHVIDQLKVDAACVLLFNPLMQTLEFASGRGFYSPDISSTQLRLTDRNNHARRAALERQTIIIQDIRKLDMTSQKLIAEKFITYYGVPLIAKGQVKGVLEVFLRSEASHNTDWIEFLEALGGQAAIAIDNNQLFSNLQRSNIELSLAYDTTLEGWGRALELRDRETEGHTKRVADLTMKLASRLGVRSDELVHIRRGVLLHDIGKMGVPDEILHKPGPLTENEWEIMRQHPRFALDLLSSIEYLHDAKIIPYCHHEKWDGSGYPQGLKGQEIPLSARIFSVIDVWDALLSDRPYREAWPKSKVVEYLKERSGKDFDPVVCKSFLQLIEDEDL